MTRILWDGWTLLDLMSKIQLSVSWITSGQTIGRPWLRLEEDMTLYSKCALENLAAKYEKSRTMNAWIIWIPKAESSPTDYPMTE